MDEGWRVGGEEGRVERRVARAFGGEWGGWKEVRAGVNRGRASHDCVASEWGYLTYPEETDGKLQHEHKYGHASVLWSDCRVGERVCDAVSNLQNRKCGSCTHIVRSCRTHECTPGSCKVQLVGHDTTTWP